MSLSRSHKQTLAILVVCVLGVAAAGYAAYGIPTMKKSQSQPVAEILTNSVIPTELATSTDWQKQFLSKGTNSIKTPSVAIKNEPVEPDTMTGEFGKKFFQQYMYLKQNNLTDDPQAIAELVNQTTNEFVATAPQARVYDVREITPTKNSGVAIERAYVNAIGLVFSTYMPSRDAGTIAFEALQAEDQTKVAEIEAVAHAYDSILKNTITIPTPATLSDQQVGLINGISAVAFASHGMTKIFSDPIQSVAAMGVYEKSIAQLRNALLDLKFYCATNNIQFSENEPASIISIMTQ